MRLSAIPALPATTDAARLRRYLSGVLPGYRAAELELEHAKLQVRRARY
jgi:hypothetical protein